MSRARPTKAKALAEVVSVDKGPKPPHATGLDTRVLVRPKPCRPAGRFARAIPTATSVRSEEARAIRLLGEYGCKAET